MATTQKKNDPNKVLPPHEASKEVFENFHRSKDLVVEKKRRQFKEYYKLYRSVLEHKDDDLMSQVVIPLTAVTIEDLIPRLVANRPRLDAQARHPEDEVKASKVRALLFYFWDLIPMAMRLIEFVKNAQIYGTAIFKVVYKQHEEMRIIRTVNETPTTFMGIPLPAMFGPPQVTTSFSAEPVLTYDDPWVDLCEIDQIYPDPDGSCIESCDWIIHRTPVTLESLKAARKDGEPLYKASVLKEAEKLGATNFGPSHSEKSVREEMQTTFDGNTETTSDPRKITFHILEQWSDSKVTTVIEELPQLEPIRNEFNEIGQKPFIRYTPIPDPNRFYGISMAEMLHSMQVELSTLHSANIDNVLYGVHQMYKVLRTSGINTRNLRFRPGGVVPVKDMGDIQPLEKNYQDLSLYRSVDDIRRWAQRVGTSDTFGGIASDLTGRTATEASLLAEASGSKAGLMFQILSVQALSPLGQLVARQYELYLDQERSLRIIGDEFSTAEFETVSPVDLVSKTGMGLDIVIDVAQTEPMNQQFKLQRAKDMLQSFGALGMQRNDPVVQYILTELLRSYGKNRPELLLQSPESQQAAAVAEASQLPPNPQGDSIASMGQQLAADQGG